MIIPTPAFDPLFAEDGIPFSRKMRQYIQREFADLLGSQATLLESEAGLAIEAAKYSPQLKKRHTSPKDAA